MAGYTKKAPTAEPLKNRCDNTIKQLVIEPRTLLL